MVHIPLRGLFLLGRTAAIVVTAAALPVLLKQAKPLAKKVGEEVEKFGKWLKEDAEPEAAAAPTAPADVAAPKTEAPKTTAKSRAKATPPKKTTTRAKPKPKAKVAKPKDENPA